MLPRIIALAFLLSGCGFVHDEPLVSRYKLVAVDTEQDMMLCWALDKGDCVGDGLPGPTVFAAGFNDRYVVAAVHPDESERTVTQFFYVVRDPENEGKDGGMPYGGVKGPFDQREYDAEKARLHLPEFSRTFENLR